jgi:hypothetical protein
MKRQEEMRETTAKCPRLQEELSKTSKETFKRTPTPMKELTLKFILAGSGAPIANVEANSCWKGSDLKLACEKTLAPGNFVKQFVFGDTVLKLAGVIGDQGVVSGSTIGVILQTTSVLFLASPCTSYELGKRRGWRVDNWGEGGGGARSRMVIAEVDHHTLEKAPATAQEIANALREAAPSLDTYKVCLERHGHTGGEVIVISNANEDPRRSCLEALRIRKQVDNMSDDNYDCDEDRHTRYEWSDPTWVKHKDDPIYQGSLWGASTLRDADFKRRIKAGFNTPIKEGGEEDDEDEAKDGNEQKAKAAAEIATATRVMAERLQRHFKFDFGYGGTIHGDAVVQVSPVVYGGYTPDGSIVGILTTRSHREPSSRGSQEGSDDGVPSEDEQASGNESGNENEDGEVTSDEGGNDE